LPRSEVAAVPTFGPDSSKDSAAPASKTPAEEAAEEAVRRMVEAAYT
jgi:hypothetical protein